MISYAFLCWVKPHLEEDVKLKTSNYTQIPKVERPQVHRSQKACLPQCQT